MHSPRFANLVGYWGIVLNITNLSGDIYVNFTISFALEMLAYVVCLYAFQHLGRKTVYITCIIAGGACCTLSIVPALLGAPCEYGLLTLEKDAANAVNFFIDAGVRVWVSVGAKFSGFGIFWSSFSVVFSAYSGFLLFFKSEWFKAVNLNYK